MLWKGNAPSSGEEWQVAVDAAKFCLMVESCQQYGLIRAEVKVNRERCEQVLRDGAERGYEPAPPDLLMEKFLPAS